MPRVILSRRATFSASHRLHSAKLSAAENRALFGKCDSPNGHGHNYIIEVLVCGPVHSKTGIVMNLVDLKQVIEETVVSRWDHKYLNLDVSEFRDLNPTAENMAVVAWNLLSKRLPKGLLHEVRIHETENNVAIYNGKR